ncbi:MAG: hypothetical protein RLZZ323_1449 [Bacteroidota bacterium]
MKKRSLIEIGELLSEMTIVREGLGVSSRQVSYWKDRKIFPFLTKEKKGLMNIPEALWLLIINELSNIGVDSKKLTRLSYEVWAKPYYEKYADTIFKKEISNNKTLKKEDKDWLKHFLETEFVMDSIYRREINPFTDAIKTCLMSRGNVISLLYCPKKDEHCFNFNNIELTSKLTNIYYKESIISIPIIPLLSKVIGADMKDSKNDLNYLTSLENQIRRIVFFDKPKLLEIVLEAEGKNTTHKITEGHKNAAELSSFFLNTKLPLGAKVLIEPRAQGNYKITIKS